MIYRNKYLLINVILIVASCRSLQINQCSPCDIKYLAIAEKIFNKSNIKNALCSISHECINNVEFMEYSNDLIFLFIEKEAEITITEISKLKKKRQDFILQILTNPINDEINLKLVRERLQNLKSRDKKEKILVSNILASLN